MLQPPLLPKLEGVDGLRGLETRVGTLRNWPKNKGFLGRGGFGEVYLVDEVLVVCPVTIIILTITLSFTCCYYEINGIQDLKICSHADSLILLLPVATCSCPSTMPPAA